MIETSRTPTSGLLAAPLLLAASCGGSGDLSDDPSLVLTVARTHLSIAVRERGELQAANDRRIISELEGRNTLIFLVPEGSVVEEGDKVAELDASLIEEKRSSQAILVAKAEAALDQARKNFEIMEKELRAAEMTAETRLQIALMRAERLLGQPRRRARGVTEGWESSGAGTNGSHAEPAGGDTTNGGPLSQAGTNAEMVEQLRTLLESEGLYNAETSDKYADLADSVVRLLREESLGLQMGEAANLILAQINEISLARADLELAADTLRHSETLAAQGFITKNELDRDTISHQRQLSQMTLAWNNLDLLVHYTLPENRITTEQEVENSRLGLESVRATGEATRVRAAAELRASEAEFELARERLDEWTEQIGFAVIHAPARGLVVYGRWDWDEPVFEGMEVREGQEIIILPDVRTMVAEVKVHEAQIDKVAAGQSANVKVDAFPGRAFAARVEEVATLPDASYRRDVKEYTVRVELVEPNTDGALRPGMNGMVEILVGALDDVIVIPLPALERRGDQHFVWVLTPEGPVARAIELGSNNLTHVEIIAGLVAGERICLVRPAGAKLPELENDAPEDDAPEGGVPEGGVPEGGVPEGGVPEGGVPEGGVPEGGEALESRDS